MNPTIKAFTLIAMGLFLYTRYIGGTLLYYINERFVWLTLFAVVGFIVMGISYRYRVSQEIECPVDHHHGNLTWGGLILVVLPIIFGLLMPPRPLGATAMSNRDVSVESFTSVAGPNTSVVMAAPENHSERNILDWLVDFWGTQDPTAFNGQEATVIGFVYRDDRFDDDSFMVARFTISCCAADAAPLGLVVHSPDANTFPTDEWVEIQGLFEAGQFDGKDMPILKADLIKPTDIPDQPYLYPY